MKNLLRFITCGSVDDGKSTLIGHMIYDAKLLFVDQKESLILDSKLGNKEGKIDYSLLLDGLIEEREQGITIDVAYRFFSTEKRSFIVADCPGHEEYTKNMAVGASFADMAIILIDVTKGILEQTKRHIKICDFMGIKYFIIAINKMDLIDYDKKIFDNIKQHILDFIEELTNRPSIHIIPVSATQGDNIIALSSNTSWYNGMPLLSLLENIRIEIDPQISDFIMPVQRVSRPSNYSRGYQGQVESGSIQVGEKVTILPNNEQAKVKNIYVSGIESRIAHLEQAVTLELDREIDVSRGCVIVKQVNQSITNVAKVKLLWMDERVFDHTDYYLFKCGTKTLPVIDMKIDTILDIHTGEEKNAHKLTRNQIAICTLTISEKMVLDIFSKQKSLGSFILINRLTNSTSACGTIESLPKGIHHQKIHKLDVGKKTCLTQECKKTLTIWFTGLSGAGKSTLAQAIQKKLVDIGKYTILLDGDSLREGINSDLSYSNKDRKESIRRITHISKMINEAGITSIVACISPISRDREYAKQVIGGGFIEIFVDTSLEECEKRDVKGLYKKARNREIENFTGISSCYEIPENPDIVVDTLEYTIEESVRYILQEIKRING